VDSGGSDADAAPVDSTVDGTQRRLDDHRRDRFLVMVAVAAAVVAVDQLTKRWALGALDHRTIDLFWTLRLRLVFNTGAAFSQIEGLGPLLALTAVVITIVLLWFGRVSPNRATSAALGSIAGGALGNLTDRIFRHGDGFLGGAVIDFIDVQWWPVWNVADMAIVLGGAALVMVTGRAR
jgi:signal peptidase II